MKTDVSYHSHACFKDLRSNWARTVTVDQNCQHSAARSWRRRCLCDERKFKAVTPLKRHNRGERYHIWFSVFSQRNWKIKTIHWTESILATSTQGKGRYESSDWLRTGTVTRKQKVVIHTCGQCQLSRLLKLMEVCTFLPQFRILENWGPTSEIWGQKKAIRISNVMPDWIRMTWKKGNLGNVSLAAAA